MKLVFKKILILKIFAILLLSTCNTSKIENRGEKVMEQRSIQEVLKSYTPELMSVPDVIGTAIGEQEGKPCIVIMVARKSQELVEKIPEELEGYPVVIKETGEIRALDKD